MDVLKLVREDKWALYSDKRYQYLKPEINQQLNNYFNLIPQNKLLDDSRHLIDRIVANDIRIVSIPSPIKCFFSITNQCNLSCVHCFTDSGMKLQNELNLEKLLDLVGELYSLGVMDISLTGGEPLVSPHLFKVLAAMASYSMSVSLTTNGSLLTPAATVKLLGYHLKSLTISVDSLKDDRIRKKLDIEKLKSNIVYLTDYVEARHMDTEIGLRMSVNQLNFNEIEDVYSFCEARGIRKLKINNTNSLGRAANVREILISEDNFRRRVSEFLDNFSMGMCKLEIPIEKYIATDKMLGKCKSGIDTFNISPNGLVEPCGFTNGLLAMGNLYENSLEHIFVNRYFSHDNVHCSSCKMNIYNSKRSLTRQNSTYA